MQEHQQERDQQERDCCTTIPAAARNRLLDSAVSVLVSYRT